MAERLLIEDFRIGLDGRRNPAAQTPGSLVVFEDGVINRGAEIEKRKAFVQVADLPSTTIGLGSTATGIYVVGAASSVTMPVLANGDPLLYKSAAWVNRTPVSIGGTTEYGNKPFYTILYTSGERWGIYDGTPVIIDGSWIYARSCDMVSNKIYMVGAVRNILKFSHLGEPTNFDPTTAGMTGAGEIALDTVHPGMFDIQAVAQYRGNIVVMARNASLIYKVAADPDENTLIQALTVGTIAPGSVRAWGDADLYFLSDSGVRTLSPRTVNDTAAVSDVGVAVDEIIRARIAAVGAATVESNASSVIEPTTGAYWLALGDRIYVLTRYPGVKIAAWSVLKPGFEVIDMVTYRSRVYLRGPGNKLYLYGGIDGNTYDSTVCVARTPFLNAGKPTHQKRWQGIDITATGTWGTRFYVDPRGSSAFVQGPKLLGTTLNHPTVPLRGLDEIAAIQVEFRSEGAGAATISQFALDYELGRAS